MGRRRRWRISKSFYEDVSAAWDIPQSHVLGHVVFFPSVNVSVGISSIRKTSSPSKSGPTKSMCDVRGKHSAGTVSEETANTSEVVESSKVIEL